MLPYRVNKDAAGQGDGFIDIASDQ